ncbi:hypothetical protein [Sphingomicrobium lutaoense]|uniref:DUF429 domain-containing protein n=1 Tax=Sphingomicrobium lutaoense TaxID=515949 RepID=A0A839YZI1_9SPHN|nr:hypothetical protein [Sphingomicrobium lutaoense]MBB3763177.1 hypothetical protein [Sphingomicrobium lutaoense]
MTRRFERFAVIDWSGAKVARPPGLAVAFAGEGDAAPQLLGDRNWSRGRILDWLKRLARRKAPVLIGLDLSPSLPFVDRGAFFPGWDESPPDAKALWAMVDELSAGDEHLSVSSFLQHRQAKRYFRLQNDCGDLFGEGRGRLRLCEERQKAAGLQPYSCMNLVGAAQVGKSSLTGMRVLHRLAGEVPIWPFDPIPEEGPLIVEIYTSLAARLAGVPKGRSKTVDPDDLDRRLAHFDSAPHRRLARYTDHATDAILTSAWLRRAAEEERLWKPPLLDGEVARTEGWTFGVL